MKLKLTELKVQSFVTSLEEEQKQTVNGVTYAGCYGAGTVDCPSDQRTLGCGNTGFCNQGVPSYQNAATGYPCPSCGGGGGTNYCTNSGCPTNGNCGSGQTYSSNGTGTGYQCYISGCNC